VSAIHQGLRTAGMLPFPGAMTSTAEISDCGLYRYSLTRRWSDGRRMLFVMLNPSTADASQDDPTIRRCIGLAKREGCGSLEVVNLFAFRATDPRALVKARDPVGPLNDHWIVGASDRAEVIVAAWGASLPAGKPSKRPAAVLRLLADRDVMALGLTNGGCPRHPLYLAGDSPLVTYRRRS